jgi:formylglycine-generating enzyme
MNTRNELCFIYSISMKIPISVTATTDFLKGGIILEKIWVIPLFIILLVFISIIIQSKSPRLKTKTLVNAIKMVPVPAGTATLQGRKVTLSKDFYIGETEVTYAQWKEVTVWATNQAEDSNKYKFQEFHGQIGDRNKGSKKQPVTYISWRDAISWCNVLSQKEGLTQVYSDDYNPIINPSANGYRLPTEAEWEYAARYIDGVNWTPDNYLSGATSDYSNEKACNKVAIYKNSKYNNVSTGQWITPIFTFFSPHTSKVKTKKANALGLYDMSGNVHEWCWDWWTEFIDTNKPAINPQGPNEGFNRTFRGGNFYSSSKDCIVSARFMNLPGCIEKRIGFRVARNY